MIYYGVLKLCYESRILLVLVLVLYYFVILLRFLYEGIYVFENDVCE